jgi:hypothetical protein
VVSQMVDRLKQNSIFGAVYKETFSQNGDLNFEKEVEHSSSLLSIVLKQLFSKMEGLFNHEGME